MGKLDDIFNKAEYAIGMCKIVSDQIDHPQGLWYHAIGMFNSFYAITEELATTTQNVPDAHLKDAVRAWREANKDSIKGFFGPARNTATHQGQIETVSFTEWQDDHLNDREEPIKRAWVSVKDSNIRRMPGNEFLRLCEKALTFLRDGIIEINEDYKRRGGSTNALHQPENYSIKFKNFKL